MEERAPGEIEVSVIIPTRNSAHLIGRALESVQAQTFTRWEALVVNDNSEDDTVDVVLGFHDPRIRLMNFNSGGIIAACRNLGIRNSRGRFVAFLDSDDKWYPPKLARSLEVMRGDVDLVAHGLVYVKDGKVWKEKLCGPKSRATYDRLLYSGDCSITTSAVVVRKACLEQAGGFIEDSADALKKHRVEKIEGFEGAPIHIGAEDYDLWLRLAKSGAKFEFLNEMLGEYHLHSRNAGRAVPSIISSQMAVLERHFAEVPHPSLWERVRRRRRKALVFYAAARNLQEGGKKAQALRLYCKATFGFPVMLKLYAATCLTLLQWFLQPFNGKRFSR